MTQLPDQFDLIEWMTLARDNKSNGAYLYSMYDQLHTLKQKGVIGTYEMDELCPLIMGLLKSLSSLKAELDRGIPQSS